MKLSEKLIGKLKLYKWNILALCLIAGVLSTFMLQKEGYHMDELLSFELSNAEYNPWIVPTQPVGRLAKFVHEEIDGNSFTKTLQNLCEAVKDVAVNKGNSKLATYKADVYEEPVWIDRQAFTDYLTVDGTDDFNYLSVYFNVKDDNHPPLHFMLLHTVSSVFKGQIAPFMGGLINLAAILGACVLLMKIGNLLWQDKKYGIAAALLYGMSSGAVATQLLIRMYGVLTFFCVAALYIHLKKWKSGDFAHNKALVLVTVLGFWTQYFFLFYMLILAAVMAAGLLHRKRFADLKKYVLSMVTAAALGLVCFPFAVSDVFRSSRGVEALEKLGSGFAEYGERLLGFGKILTERVLGGMTGILLILGVAAVTWIFRFMKKKKSGTVKAAEKKTEHAKVPESTGDIAAAAAASDGWVKAILIVPVIGYFLLAAKLSPYLVDRYIMAVFPFAALLLVAALVHLKMPFAGMMAVAAGFFILLFSYDGEYLYRGYQLQESMAEKYGEYPCICVYEGSGYYENLIEFTKYERTLLVTPAELLERTADEVLDAGEPVVVLVKGGLCSKPIKEYLENRYGYRMTEELVRESVYGDRICLYEQAE